MSETGLEGTALEDHMDNIRNRAWGVMSYPCFGGWSLLPGLSEMKASDEVMNAAKQGKTIAEFGCGLGQDLRRLRAEVGNTAAPKFYAIDSRKEFWDLGCEILGDGAEPVAEFLFVDLVHNHIYSEVLEPTCGKVDVIFTSQFLDLLCWQYQLRVADIMVRMSKTGTKIVGLHLRNRRTWWGISKPRLFWNASWQRWMVVRDAMDRYRKSNSKI